MIYIDDMFAAFRRYKMSHLIADTDEELFAMVDKIGVQRKWHQAPPRHDSHFDIAAGKRLLAINAGAIPITWVQASAMSLLRRAHGGPLVAPDVAVAAYQALRESGFVWRN